MIIGGLIVWALVGLAFFGGCVHHSGLPAHRKSKGREPGWQEVLMFLLPACIVGGPIWWMAWAIYRVRS